MTISIIKTPTFENYFDISSFAGHNSNVNSLQFSSNDEYLISASADKTVVVWSVGQKKGHKSLVIDWINWNSKSTQEEKNLSLPSNPGFKHEIKKA